MIVVAEKHEWKWIMEAKSWKGLSDRSCRLEQDNPNDKIRNANVIHRATSGKSLFFLQFFLKSPEAVACKSDCEGKCE